jgi:light-regulated signal transduction histidine kinase (bacteriophytochrome)
MKEVLDNLRVAIAESGAKIVLGPLPVVRGDRNRLTQLFQNLISNSINFRGTEPPLIAVHSEREGEKWRFSVTDNGLGFSMENAKRVFMLFQRLDHVATSGTGVGLAVCKKIVESHGGQIWVESAPGGGSTFFFTLSASL